MEDARMYEYTSAANINLTIQPVHTYRSELHKTGKTRIIPFDLSTVMKLPTEATSPNLLASFVKICGSESIETKANATSQVFYIIRGSGKSNLQKSKEEVIWKQGDLFVVPSTEDIIHYSHEDTAMYWIHDEPLLQYLGVISQIKKFNLTHFTKEKMFEEIEIIASDENAIHKNRLGILLGNKATEKYTKTLTHTMWGLLNMLPSGVNQKPHRHNSVALDLCIKAKSSENEPLVYTLMGPELDENGWVKNPIKCVWTSESVFTTPPGWWHSHHNESDEDAWVLPIQDAGLLTHQRILDIQFSS